MWARKRSGVTNHDCPRQRGLDDRLEFWRRGRCRPAVGERWTDQLPNRQAGESLGRGRVWQLGERLFEPGANNVWTAYVSLKFDGPTYGSKPNEPLLAPADRIHYRGLAESDLVLVDRIILVKKG